MHQDGTACDMLPGMSVQLIRPAERACLEPPAGVYVVAVELCALSFCSYE